MLLDAGAHVSPEWRQYFGTAASPPTSRCRDGPGHRRHAQPAPPGRLPGPRRRGRAAGRDGRARRARREARRRLVAVGRVRGRRRRRHRWAAVWSSGPTAAIDGPQAGGRHVRAPGGDRLHRRAAARRRGRRARRPRVLVGEGDVFFLLFHQGGGGRGPTSAPGCLVSTASPARSGASSSSRPARRRAIRGASRSPQPHPPARAPPIPATTPGRASPTSTAPC